MTIKGENRRARDIEALLQWTFRDELPKIPARDERHDNPGWPSATGLFRLAQLGNRIDEGLPMTEPGFPAAVGEPHPDAIVIGRAVEQLDYVHIDWPETRRTMVGAFAGLLTDDEPTLKYLKIGVAGLVAVHAKMKTRPQWDLWPLPEPVIGPNGKPKVQFEDEQGHLIDGRKGRHYGPSARSPLTWFPAPQEAAFVRIEYSIWWQALDGLAEYLEPLLEEHLPLAPAAHPSPWVM